MHRHTKAGGSLTSQMVHVVLQRLCFLYCVDDFMHDIRGSTYKTKTNADHEGSSDLARNENLILWLFYTICRDDTVPALFPWKCLI